MQTLEVTDDQYAFIQHLREEISEDVVGKYGYVREQDALQYLIDNLDDDIDLDGEFDSSATDDVAASVGAAIDGDPDPTALEEVAYDETTASKLPDESSVGDDGESATDDEDSAGDTGDEDDVESNADDASGDADDDEMLDEMMSLLETHDDKWAESDSSDHRYTVTLPDGSTEDVQTKDDVRALLFKNYR
ncbi:hypothetical protein D8Y22_13970 [Salinadaptatus halalkaliphilus]|uniref:Uncharacterized protein n=1 Tax=Salinadaptatus halalkaliphilus TaxID=2419781 RepID=A0A4S3TKS6_9EURY|nr:hypothetical protein [Salinadaptatus halalkaliphilus]THE64170.1 hypothetical protein D8Y22_13970 [Salinadaptatus halalkaliphilus]